MEVTYIDHLGDDLRVVDAARVSFNKTSEWELKSVRMEGPEKVLSLKDKKLISYLARNGHWTPFSHPMITMREKVPIFVARQRFKHMVGFTYNEVSRRYVDDAPEFFYPDEWRGKPVNAKQGSSDEVITEDIYGSDLKKKYHSLIVIMEAYYKALIESGVAPEQARMVLPQSMYTEYYVTGSLAAWSRAYKQRIDGHAQKEIQEVAIKWDEIIRPLFPVSWEALTQS